MSPTIVNITALLCFTALAMMFDHWWIALFSIFFLSSYETKEEEPKSTLIYTGHGYCEKDNEEE